MFESRLNMLLRPFAAFSRIKKRPERSKRRAANPLRLEHLEDRVTPVTFSPGATAATINAAITGNASGTTFTFNPGTYILGGTINASVANDVFQGNNAGTSANGPRATESVLTDTAGAEASIPQIFHVTANGVTINGFTLDGAANTVQDGIDVTSSSTASPITGTKIQNNIIQNLDALGVLLFNAAGTGLTTASSGNSISQNLIQNYGNGGGSSPFEPQFYSGISLVNDADAGVTANQINTTTGIFGIYAQTFFHASTDGTMQWTGNVVTVTQGGVGIFVNNFFANAPGVNITGNAVVADDGVTTAAITDPNAAFGIALASLSEVNPITVNDTIRADIAHAGTGVFTRGIEMVNVGTAPTVDITGGTISASTTGIALDNFNNPPTLGIPGLTSPSYMIQASTVNVTGTVNITGATTAVDVEGGSGSTTKAILDIDAGASITGGGTVQAENGGTLAGAGSITGNVNIKTGGILAPGDLATPPAGSPPGHTIGTLTVSGNATFDSSSFFFVNVGPGATPTVNDKLSAGGTITLGNATLEGTSGLSAAATPSFTIIQGGTVNGTFGGTAAPPTESITLNGTAFGIVYTMPAPGSVVLSTGNYYAFTPSSAGTNGYTPITPSTPSFAINGSYGWIGTPPLGTLTRPGVPPLPDTLAQDAGLSYDTKQRTFGVGGLTAGTYAVTVIQGDYYTVSPGQHSNMLVTAYEDNTLGSPIGSTTAVTVPYEQFADQTFEVTITGGGTHTLDLVFTGSNDYWVVNDLVVRPISNVLPITFTEMGQTTTATGTTIDEFKGTVAAPGLLPGSLVTVSTTLGTIVNTDSSFNPLPDASPLFYGTQVTDTLSPPPLSPPPPPAAGSTFYFELVETGGLGTAELTASAVTGLAVTTAPTAVNFTAPGFRNIAFRAGTSPALTSGSLGGNSYTTFISIAPPPTATEFTTTQGYGWNGTSASFSVDRGLTAQPNPLETGIQFDTATRYFSVILAPGTYTVNAYMGDTAVAHTNMSIIATQGASTLYSSPSFSTVASANYLQNAAQTFQITVTGTPTSVAPVTLQFAGTNNYWVLSDLTFAPSPPPPPLLLPPPFQSFDQVAASEAPPSKTAVPSLTQAELQPIVTAAIQRYAAAGLDAKDLALLRSVSYQITDLRSLGLLGETPINGHTVTLDATGAGYGWYIDATPTNDNGFAVSNVASTQLNATSSAAAGHYDLLTVVMHELGHVLGKADVANASAPGNLMDAVLSLGMRRLPTGDVAVFTSGSNLAAVANTLSSRH